MGILVGFGNWRKLCTDFPHTRVESMKRFRILPMKSIITAFFLGVPALFVGNAFGWVPDCTLLALSNQSHVVAPAAHLPRATLAEARRSVSPAKVTTGACAASGAQARPRSTDAA